MITPPSKMLGFATGYRAPLPNWRNMSGIPKDEISYWIGGINHMAWFLDLKWQGKRCLSFAPGEI